MTTFTEYLAQPCDEEGCDHPATHNGTGRNTGTRGRWCNQHTSWDHPAFARDD